MSIFLILILLSSFECPFLRINYGARSSALGETYAGLADEVSYTFLNPGAVGKVEFSQVAFLHNSWFEGFRDEYFSTALARLYGTLGLTYIYNGAEKITKWDHDNNKIGTFTPNSWILQLSAATKFSPKLAIGTNFKVLHDRIDDCSATGWAVDIGTHYQIAQNLGIGWVAQNLGLPISYGKKSFPLPWTTRVGCAYKISKGVLQYAPTTLTRWTCLFDLEYDKIGTYAHIGTELGIHEMLALRLGYRTGPQNLGNITFGFGVTTGPLGIDYACVPYGVLGSTHRILLGYRFGKLPRVGSLKIIVVDAKTNKRIPANVEVSGVTRKSTTGSVCRLRNVSPGEVKVKVSRERYYAKAKEIKIERDVSRTIVVPLERIPSGRIRGTITDAETKSAIPAHITYKGPVSGEFWVAQDGKFSLPHLDPGTYVLNVEPKDPSYYAQVCSLKVVPGTGVSNNFALLKKKGVLVLRGVNFETAKATILSESYPILKYAGEILKATPNIKIEIAGHTDNRPIKTDQFASNMELGAARAGAVRKYLILNFGIKEDVLIAKGSGDTEPIASNETPEGRALNRRVEFRVISE